MPRTLGMWSAACVYLFYFYVRLSPCACKYLQQLHTFHAFVVV